MSVHVYDRPPSLSINSDFTIEVQAEDSQIWLPITAYAVDLANASTTSNSFNRHTVAVASFDLDCSVRVKVIYNAGPIDSAVIRPRSLGVEKQLQGNTVIFSLSEAKDVMLELNGNKWTALHLLTNKIDQNAPTEDTDNIWYFGPGINQGSAYAHVTDGVNLMVPSGKTVYLAGGAFITCRLNFINVSNSAVRGHGFILGPKGGYVYREHGGAIHMSGASNIHIQNCVLLPDIAHAINMGTHGNPSNPETTSHVTIRNIDILDHEENQLWYQGCIAINAADMNLLHDIHIEDIRVERITRGQLLNLRVMQNAMWTTAPGRGIRDINIKNMSLDLHESKVVNPSLILGYDQERQIENVTFENLKIDGKVIHGKMEKPRWYMVEDMIPLFVNEHVNNVKFLK